MTTQTKTTHTPGPWGWTYDGSSDYTLGQLPDPQGVTVCNVWERIHGKAIGNLNLISSAPDMLEMLYAVLPAVEEADEFNKPTHKNGPKVRALIAKAEGRI